VKNKLQRELNVFISSKPQTQFFGRRHLHIQLKR
jgi:hypothetical protein